ncbi:hypothetical protein [Bradyrhizobium genosp. P]|uniref:hypothetical protein n=1 Tax=Bradyrhizobium genosp. P TaxID=83641 RepID=UPI003CEA268B
MKLLHVDSSVLEANSISRHVSAHALVGAGGKVRVIAVGETWLVREVKSALKEG